LNNPTLSKLLKRLLARKPFQKRLERKPSNNAVGVINRLNGCSTNLLKKGLIENPEQ